MAKTIGIDLGTTNTVMFHMHTEPEIILSVTHDRLTPSVVGLATSRKLGKTIYVGSVAVNYGNTLGANFLYSTKRLMGRSYDDHEVQRMLPGGDKKVTYQILPSPEGKEDVVKVQLGDDLLNPRDVATLILKHIKEQAQKNLGDEVDSAVITVPAYFNERQKYATREAGRMAGFKVKRVMDEPTAAAIAYGVGQDDDKDKMILVFDLGGGTFDVSIMLSVGGVFPQVNTAGDMWLGGDDFDQLIMNMALKEMEREYEIANASEQLDFVHDLRIKAREVKEALSSQMVAPLILKTPFKDEVGMPITIEQEITRQEFERALAPYVDKAMGIVRLALEGEGLDKDDIDVVLMVGGSSTIPAFQKAVKDFFGAEKVYNQIDPMTCVAQGAAILAKSLSDMECPKCGEPNPLDADKCQKCQSPLMGEESQGARVKNYISRTPMPLGIEIKGGTFVTIIPKNTPYPTDEPFEQEFRTIMPGQTLIKIPVYQGFSEMAQENEFMGNIWFHDLPAGLPQDTPLTISMQLDEDMISTIGCRVRGTDWFRTRSMEYGGWETPVLNEALNTHVEMQKEGLHDSGEMQQHIEGIKKAVEESDEKAAKEHAAALDRIKKERAEGKKAAGGGAGDGWKNGVRNIMAMASNNIDRIRKVLPEDDDKLKKYDQWRKKAEQALNGEITVDPEAIVREGIEVTGAVPLAGDLMMASMLAAMLEESHPSLATRLHQGKEEILTHVDRRDLNSLPAIKKKLDEAMAEALSIIQQSGRNLADSIETMVDRA